MRYIDEHVGTRDGDGLRWGVESICVQLTKLGAKIAPATYYEHRTRKPTFREVRDEELKAKITKVHEENYGVYEARKVWLMLNRERAEQEVPIARCTVEGLMTELGLASAVRGKVKRTTISDLKASKLLDLVNRGFAPLAPNRLWVADFTYVDMVRMVLHRVRRRCLCPPDSGLVGIYHYDEQARHRRRRASDLDSQP